MSETLEAPLNPEISTDTVVEEAPQDEAPEINKPLQQLQQKQANFQREISQRFDTLTKLVESAMSTKSPAARQSKLESIQTRLKGELGQNLSPDVVTLLADVTEEIAEVRKGSGDYEALKQRQDARDAYDAYMEDKPAGFKEAYSREQRRLMDEVREEGLNADETSLGIAMKQWEKRYLKEKTAQPANTAIAPGVKRIVPPNTGARKIQPPPPNGNPFGVKVGDTI